MTKAYIEVKEEITYNSLGYPLDTFYSKLKAQADALEAAGWTDLKVSMRYFYFMSQESGEKLCFVGKRLESDNEYQARLASEEMRQQEEARRRRKEFDLYVTLKKKFESEQG